MDSSITSYLVDLRFLAKGNEHRIHIVLGELRKNVTCKIFVVVFYMDCIS